MGGFVYDFPPMWLSEDEISGSTSIVITYLLHDNINDILIYEYIVGKNIGENCFLQNFILPKKNNLAGCNKLPRFWVNAQRVSVFHCYSIVALDVT